MPPAHTRLPHPAVGATALGLCVTSVPHAGAQASRDSTARRPRVSVEARVGQSVAVRTPLLSDAAPALGAGVTVRVARQVGVWASLDLRPSSTSPEYPTREVAPSVWEGAPAVALRALTAGVSLPGRVPVFGFPLETGLGLGATRVALSERVGGALTIPPGARFDDLPASGLLEATGWRPTGAARLRVDVPVGRVLRLQASGAVLATRVGDVRLWDGTWAPAPQGPNGVVPNEPPADGSLRPGSRTWRFGTIYAVPISLGVGLHF